MLDRALMLFVRIIFSASFFVIANTSISLAAEFSADISENHGGQTFAGKIYIRGDRMIRREGVRGGRNTISIYRMDKGTVWILMPETKTYMEVGNISADDKMEMEKAASDMADKKELGTETMNGFLCDKIQYVYRQKSMGVMTQWIAKDLNYPIKTEQTGARGFEMRSELTNIRVQSLPDSLFELPPGYSKTTVPGMGIPTMPKK